MPYKLAAAAAVLVALTLGGFNPPTVAATNEVPQPWIESSSTPPATPAPQPRRRTAKPKPAPRVEAPVVVGAGEAAGSVERPRTSATTRAQVQREARASRNQRRTPDGWEQVGGEGGTRSGPK